ncbi:unnamed protein product [Linum trigynum]|uniref:Uncharacterized protein n=1 Tax=Linum trigynum TaxID=586398 RepID=A0AAV2CJV2_9ROSI
MSSFGGRPSFVHHPFASFLSLTTNTTSGSRFVAQPRCPSCLSLYEVRQQVDQREYAMKDMVEVFSSGGRERELVRQIDRREAVGENVVIGAGRLLGLGIWKLIIIDVERDERNGEGDWI